MAKVKEAVSDADMQDEVKDAEETEITPKKRSRKVKYITLYSSFLMKETKHELIGEPIETESGRQQWAKCTRSHHSQLVNLDEIERKNDDKSKAIISVSKEAARSYSPTDTYSVGDVIFHKAWDDIGIVQKKDVTSNGGSSIVVQFEKNLEKRLVENFKIQ